ncbi:hypothetical protein [Reyranella soli]|uniref:Uncharacterized protein n=1 Tax=Reyranella soli TaxID=1230389 RepID=A0A512NR83_9HYPH|nr:hypothetical protein [Reyranella soli]GEP61432.1 hypothetical protein RSO01_85980 [Reyranella soli]
MMIVARASFEDGRTVWRFEVEAGDDSPSQPKLWIAGFLREIPGDIEALWLTLVLGPFAAERIVVPGAAPRRLCDRLETVFNIAVVTAGGLDSVKRDVDRRHRATLIRDPLDLAVAELLRERDHFAVEVSADSGLRASTMTTFGVACNAGVLRRSQRPLDRVGELGVLWLVAPMLALDRNTAFLCRDELGDIAPEVLRDLAGEVGISLRLPFAEANVALLPQVLLKLGLPPIVSFRGLWDRYRMYPELMSAIFSQMEPSLQNHIPDDPLVKLCQAMIQLTEFDRVSNVGQTVPIDTSLFALAD